MTRRHVHLRDELGRPGCAILAGHGLDVDVAQHWLRHHEIDGCTLGPDIYLAACAVHDYMCRTGCVPRHEADDIARDLIVSMAEHSQDEALWRWCGVAYAWVFWAAVALGGALGIGKAEVEA